MALKQNNIKNLKGGSAVKCKATVMNLSDNTDVFATDSDGNVKEFNGNKFPLPIHVTISVDDKEQDIKEVLEFESNTILSPKSWNKKFYVGNKDGFVRTTADHAILWLFKIAVAKDPELMSGSQFDLNDLEEMPFDAMIVKEDDYCFIDWIGTLEANGVSTPSAKELNTEEVFKDDVDSTPMAKAKEFAKEMRKDKEKVNTNVPLWKQ